MPAHRDEHDPSLDITPPCSVCGGDVEADADKGGCICPECPTCGAHGDPACYADDGHGLIPSGEQLAAKANAEARWEDENRRDHEMTGIMVAQERAGGDDPAPVAAPLPEPADVNRLEAAVRYARLEEEDCRERLARTAKNLSYWIGERRKREATLAQARPPAAAVLPR